MERLLATPMIRPRLPAISVPVATSAVLSSWLMTSHPINDIARAAYHPPVGAVEPAVYRPTLQSQTFTVVSRRFSSSLVVGGLFVAGSIKVNRQAQQVRRILRRCQLPSVHTPSRDRQAIPSVRRE